MLACIGTCFPMMVSQGSEQVPKLIMDAHRSGRGQLRGRTELCLSSAAHTSGVP